MMNITRTTWTPTISASTPGDLSVAYTVQNGVFTQSGSLIRMTADIGFTPTYTTAASLFLIQGWPMVPVTGDLSWMGELRSATNFTWPVGATMLVPVMNPNGNANIVPMGTGVGNLNFFITVFPSGTAVRLTVAINGIDPTN